MNQKTLDLTQGSVPRRLLVFAWPMILANLMQSVYGIVDLLIVGQFVGKAGLSGVSSATSITNLLLMLGIGFALGAQLLIAQYRGMGDEASLEQTFGTAATFLLCSSVVIMLPGIFLAEPMLRLINTPEASLAPATSYLSICMTGTPFIYLYNCACALLRGMGDSKRPMLFVGLACLLNIGLDFLFVGPLNWGTGGAAGATVISQAVSCLSIFLYLYRKRQAFGLQLRAHTFRMQRRRLRLLLKTGIPCALQSSVIDIGIVILIAIINTYGVDASAGYSVGGRVGSMLAIPLFGVCGAASTMAGQNFGAGDMQRVSRCVWWSVGITSLYALVLALALQLPGVGEALVRLFNADPAVVEIGAQYLRIFAFAYVAIALLNSFTAAASGAGNTRMTMIANLTDGIIGRLSLVALSVYVLDGGLTGIFLATTAAPFCGLVVAAAYFFSGRWKTYQVDRSR